MAADSQQRVSGSTLQRMAHWIEAGWRRFERRHELDGISQEDLALLARDIGIPAGDLERLSQQDSGASSLLEKRLELLDIGLAQLEREGLLRDMQRTCGLCDHRDICRHDLNTRPEADHWNGYCPNSDVLKTMAAK